MPKYKRIMEQLRRSWWQNITLFQNNPNVITSTGGSNKRIKLHIIYWCPSASTNEGSWSSQVPTTRYQNCKGEFIKKETNNYQITIIGKRNNNKYHAHRVQDNNCLLKKKKTNHYTNNQLTTYNHTTMNNS